MEKTSQKMVKCGRLTAGIFSLALAGLLVVGTGTAQAAKDQLEIKIAGSTKTIVSTDPVPVDTFTGGNIQITFHYEGTSFPTSGTFGTITVGMNLVDLSASPGTDTEYPVTVNIGQSGNPELLLTADSNQFANIASAGEFGLTTITMAFNCDAVNGCVGTLADPNILESSIKFDEPSGKNELNSNNLIQVRIVLVEPQGACLGVESFITNQGLDTVINSTEVVTVRAGKNAGKVNSTTPFGQHSYNVLVANTCPGTPESFDLLITLDESYDTNPSNNPGNAVFTYLAGSSIDLEEGFDIENFYNKTPQGQTLCLENVEMEGGETFLATVHMGIQRGIHVDSLGEKFEFSAALYQAGSGCGGTVLADDEATLEYTIK